MSTAVQPEPETLVCPHCQSTLVTRKAAAIDPATEITCKACGRPYSIAQGRNPAPYQATVVGTTTKPSILLRIPASRRTESFVIGALQFAVFLCLLIAPLALLKDADGAAGAVAVAFIFQSLAVLFSLVRSIRDRLGR